MTRRLCVWGQCKSRKPAFLQYYLSSTCHKHFSTSFWASSSSMACPFDGLSGEQRYNPRPAIPATHIAVPVRTMAGHSKWSNIKHVKAAKDDARQRMTSIFLQRLRAFVGETGETDPKLSSQLAKMLADAKSKNIPSATIEKALANMVTMKNSPPMIMEGQGPYGSVMLVEVVTDKATRTKQQLQSIVKKCGFSMMGSGNRAHVVFEEKGVVQVSCPADENNPDLEKYVDIAIEAGAENVTLEDSEEGGKILQFVCIADDVRSVKTELEKRDLDVMSAERTFIATQLVPMDSASVELVTKVIGRLEDHPEVMRVFTNITVAS